MADFVQIPPDSTGKQIRHSARQEIRVASTLVDLSQFELGEAATGLTSGITGIFTGFGNDLTDTIVYIKDATGTFVVGETIQLNGTPAVVVAQTNLIYTPNTHLADPANPNNRQKVDSRGGAYTRFQEGDLQFSSIGSAQVTETSVLGDFMFTYIDDPTDFWNQEEVGGTLGINPTGSYMSCLTTADSGSRATKTSNQYFPYQPGVGVECIFTAQYSDNGKANNVRSFGMFDLNDGLFLRLDVNGMNVVQRSSSAGGTRVDIVVNRANWNTTTLTDSNKDPFVLDVTKYNLYWIDYLWLGTGRVRFGVYAPDGTRTVCHVFENANANVLPSMKRGTLPIKFGNRNFDTTSGPSELKITCISVLRQAPVQQAFSGKVFTSVSNRVAISGSLGEPVFSVKPSLTFNGQENRVTFIPTDIELIVEGDPVIVDFRIAAELTGSSFIQENSNSAFLIDKSATDIGPLGLLYGTNFYGTGTTQRIIEESFDFSVKLGADGVTQPQMTMVARTANPSGTADVTALVRWKEVR